MRRKSLCAGKEYGCRTNNLSLLARVYSHFRTGEAGRSAKSNLDKYQAFVVQHDQVNFAAAILKVPADRREAVANQEPQRGSFCPRA